MRAATLLLLLPVAAWAAVQLQPEQPQRSALLLNPQNATNDLPLDQPPLVSRVQASAVTWLLPEHGGRMHERDGALGVREALQGARGVLPPAVPLLPPLALQRHRPIDPPLLLSPGRSGSLLARPGL